MATVTVSTMHNASFKTQPRCRQVAIWSVWAPRGGYCHTKACRQRELLKHLSNIYKCKVSPGRTFSLGNFLFNETENYQVKLGHKERRFTFFLWTQRKKLPKTGALARHIHVYLSIGSTPPPPVVWARPQGLPCVFYNRNEPRESVLPPPFVYCVDVYLRH